LVEIVRDQARTKLHNKPCENGAFFVHRQPKTNCHRGSGCAVTTASASPIWS
jgi:hypothetical protein